MTYCNGETSVIRHDLTSPGAYLILFLGESLISQPSGEVHTPVWPQAFMDPVGHSDPLYEGSPMEADSFGAVPAAQVCALPSKAERTQMNDSIVIIYNGAQVSVPREVADFLEQDRKREQAQEKQDARHLSKSAFETVLSGWDGVKRPVEDAVLRNLRLENLRRAIAGLDVQGQNLISLSVTARS